MDQPDFFNKNAVMIIHCAHETCQETEFIPLVDSDDYEINLSEGPRGFARIQISHCIGVDGRDAPRVFFYCAQHARELFPGYFDRFSLPTRRTPRRVLPPGGGPQRRPVYRVCLPEAVRLRYTADQETPNATTPKRIARPHPGGRAIKNQKGYIR